MQKMKTSRCVVCSAPAVDWHGYVVGREKQADGSYARVNISAGFCDRHKDRSGQGMAYDAVIMGDCIPVEDGDC